VLRKGVRYMLNPGSVGQPRDGDPRSSYLVLEDGAARWHRVRYDVASAQGKILAADLPPMLAARLQVGR
jgi:diadenosine tetraphosphatase ApaH/serine/threonine PP2A family protein phosphatase